MHKFGVPVIVAINRFPSDTEAELAVVDKCCREMNVPYALSEVFAKGGEGGVELAKVITEIIDKEDTSKGFAPIYSNDLTVEEKINAIATKIYGADGVTYTTAAKKALKEIHELGGDKMPVCIAKLSTLFPTMQHCWGGLPALPSPSVICGFPMARALSWPMPAIS